MEPSDTQSEAPGPPFAPQAAHTFSGSQKDAGRHFPTRGNGLQRSWSRVLDVALVLWVLRVPLISVGLGLLLMLGVTQAQDTLVDIAMSGALLAQRAWFGGDILWLVASTFILWAMPVHYAGRLLLETDSRVTQGRQERDRAVAPAAPPDGMTAADAGDAFTHGILRWAPRVLGALPFIAMACGALAAIGNLPNLQDAQVRIAARQQLQLIAVVMLVCVPVFLGYTVVRSRLVRMGPLSVFDAALGRVFARAFRFLRVAPRAGEPNGELFATGRLILALYALIVIGVLIMKPLVLAQGMRLALAMPLILGGWVPLGAYLSSLGRQWHAPLLSGLAAASVLGAFLFDHHAVRVAPQAATPRPTLGVALDDWMKANGCADAPANCPRPILIAAAGGASRAGFFTASVFGHFMDLDRHAEAHTFTRADGLTLTVEPGDNGRFPPPLLQQVQRRLNAAGEFGPSASHGAGAPGSGDFATRVFAISGVSGGSFGAMVTAAALEAAPNREPPCGVRPPPFWFSDDRVRTWQDCLEALTSGDYLTPAFFGLAFHDQVQLPQEDRAALLEDAWAERFKNVIGSGPLGAESAAAARLTQPFLQARPTGQPWVPLLVLNGTSVATGQRIITTNLAPFYAAPHACPTSRAAAPSHCPVFTQAIDFHTMLGGNRDVSMATAATNSARFPIISPPGTIQNPEGNTLDRIVDGGYFENFGVHSAFELAKAIVTLQPKLAPFILVISNDPASTFNEELKGEGAQMPDASDHVWLPEATVPIGATGTVRSGRGRLDLTDTALWLRATFGGACPSSLAHIKVWPEARDDGRCPFASKKDEENGTTPSATLPQIRDVSMSWWLSKPVQMNLREQLRIREADAPGKTGCSNDAAVRAVWTAMITPSSQCTVPARDISRPAGGTPP